MKKLLTLSLLVTKLTALYCFSAMGLMAWDPVEAKSPCHEETEVVSEVEEHQKEDCDVCIIAADAWNQELIAASDIELEELVVLISTFPESIIEAKPLLTSVYEQYYPPPQVLYKTAFHLPQRVTVILS